VRSCGTRAMRIDNVIFCWDGNPLFAGMWEIVSRRWSRLGVQPHLFIVGDARVSGPYGYVHRLQPMPEHRPWMTTIALLWGACQVPGVNMTSGIDQVPTSTAWLRVCSGTGPCDMICGFAGAPGYHGTAYVPSSHVVAGRETWAAMLTPGGYADAVAAASGLTTIWPDWGHDEAWLAAGLQRSHAIVNRLPPRFFREWDAARLDRARGDMPAPGREYSELHLHRPLSANPPEWLALCD